MGYVALFLYTLFILECSVLNAFFIYITLLATGDSVYMQFKLLSLVWAYIDGNAMAILNNRLHPKDSNIGFLRSHWLISKGMKTTPSRRFV